MARTRGGNYSSSGGRKATLKGRKRHGKALRHGTTKSRVTTTGTTRVKAR